MRKFTDKLNESVEDKIPTAEELIRNIARFESPNDVIPIHSLDKIMIEFAKLHVEAALKNASEKIKLTDEVCEVLQEHWFEEYIDKSSILNAYPLENIK